MAVLLSRPRLQSFLDVWPFCLRAFFPRTGGPEVALVGTHHR